MVDLFEQELFKLNLPNYQNYNDINEAYNNFIQKIMNVIDNVAPMKARVLGFRNYYSTLENLVKMLPKPTNRYSINAVIKCYEHMILGDYFHLASVLENSVLTILKATQVSKAAGIDNLSGCFLKNGANVLPKPISDLCNLSIISEKFPDICKVVKLKTLCKKGSLTEPCNYRPTSLLPPNIQSYTKDYSRSNKYFPKFEKPFIHLSIWYSMDFCLTYLNDEILKRFGKGMIADMTTGFSKYTVNWFKSYLSNRSFLVNLGNNSSQPASVSCGVPQGSILGTLLFLPYVNGMSQTVKCHLFLYADDSCLVCQHKDINEIEK